MNKQIFTLAHQEARRRALTAVAEAPEGFVVRISPATRSLEQNALLWSRLNDIALQVEWHGRRLDAESWKHVFSSSLKRMDVVPNLEGTGFVALGLSTSRMTKQEFADLLELIQAFGAERGVRWTLDEVEA
jgi:hypothetical protein